MARVRSSEIRNYEPLLLFIGVTLLLFFGRALLIPLAFALTLCFLVLPVIRQLESRKIPRPIAVAVVGIATCVILVCGSYVLSRQIFGLVRTLPSYRENMQRRIDSLHSPAEDAFDKAAATLRDIGNSLSPGEVPAHQPVSVRIVPNGASLQFAYSVAGWLLRPLAQIGIVIIFAMYMLMRREELRHRLLMLAGTAQLGVMTRTMDEAANRISRYLVLQLEMNACFGVLFGLGLYLIGVPNAILWGIIAGALRIVPYAGTAVGMLFPLLASIAVSTTWWPTLFVLIWFVAQELIFTYFLEPRIFSSRTGISSLALLVSAVFWTMLWGWPGLALATPMTVCVVVVGQYVPQLSFLHSLLGTDARLSPAAHFYERLLATDHTEAYAIAERFLRERPLIELYDSVLIRTLHVANEDKQKGALDDARFRFLLLSVGELIAMLAEAPQAVAGAAGNMNGDRRGIAREPVPGAESAVVCISSADPPDKLATQMLAQVLEHAGFKTILLSLEALSNEILSALASEKNTIVVISALPPFAFAQARSMCQRVRQHLRDNRIAIALWRNPDDQDDTASRFGSGRPNALVSTLSQAMSQIEAWQEIPVDVPQR